MLVASTAVTTIYVTAETKTNNCMNAEIERKAKNLIKNWKIEDCGASERLQ